MKIAVITEQTSITLGGAERSIFELTKALSSLGLEVDILAAKGRINAGNVHILCKDTTGSIPLSSFTEALKRHLSENHYDIIHSVLPFDFADIYQPRGGTYAESILRNAASYQSKLIQFYKRITAFANLRRTILLRAERNICRNPDGPVIAALSQYVARQFKEHYGLDDDRIVVISNGVKINKKIHTDKADKLRTQILARLNLKEADRPVLFLFAAHNFRLKGLCVLIKAMSCVTGKRPACLIIVGRGKTYKYRLLAGRFNVRRRLLFLGKIKNIQNILSICDVAVLPSFYDPSSRYTLEALAAGKPVITTKFNGATDLFADNRHGKVIQSPQDIDALTEAVSYFTDTENIQRASDAIAGDNLAEKISIARVARQLNALYESILEKRRQQ